MDSPAWVLLLLAVALTPAILMVQNTLFRLYVVVFGALLVFQSSGDINVPKVAYLGAFAIAFALTLKDPSNHLKRSSLAVALLLTNLCVVALLRGRDPLWIVRDASNYFVLLTAASLAQTFGFRLKESSIRRATVTAAGFGAYAFVAQWISNRGLAELPTPGAPSTAMITLAVAGSSAMATLSRRSMLWWSVCGVLLIGGLLTGTRNMLLSALAPILIAAWSSTRMRNPQQNRRARRAFVSAIVALPFAASLALGAASVTPLDTDAAFERIVPVLSLNSDAVNRQSLDERYLQQKIAWDTFVSDPTFGSGPGTLWTWQAAYAVEPKSSYQMDTSVVVLAKWGLIGTVALAALLFRWGRFLWPKRSNPNVWSVTALGVIPVLVLQSFLAPVVEDRGLPLVLILLGAGVISCSRGDDAVDHARQFALGGSDTARLSRFAGRGWSSTRGG
jgi:hypothetical protein